MIRLGIAVFTIGWVLLLGTIASAQEIFEYMPDDAILLPQELRDFDENYIFKLGSGVYDMEAQLYFKGGSPILEGAGSGFGSEATVLDFLTYSLLVEDSRALSIRGPVTIRNLTIVNVGGRAMDLRTGNIGTPSDVPVIFENVWFVNCRTVFKSTGGRTVGTPEAPMIVKNCVAAIAADYPSEFGEPQSAINLRDTSYAWFDHCDFFNLRELTHLIINDPVEAPNDGPGVTVTNSILLGTNGNDGTVETDDLYVNAGSATLNHCVLWDLLSEGELLKTGDGTLELADTITANPMYAAALPTLNADELDFNLLPGSPGNGLGSDGLNAGSIAEEPVAVFDWSLF